VANLVPAEEPRSVYQQMVAAGQVRPALARGTRGLPPPLPLDDDGPSLSEVLRQMRDEERY